MAVQDDFEAQVDAQWLSYRGERLFDALGPLLERALLQMAKGLRVTSRNNNGDIFAFESADRERAAKKLEQFQSRKELHDVKLEAPRLIGDRSKRFRVTGTDRNGDVHAFETSNRDRTREMLEEFKKRFQDVEQEMLRWA